jgi:hypothetical protein
MDSQALTLFHVAISLIANASGFDVAYGLFNSSRMPSTTLVFLVTTFLTSLTGFVFFQRDEILPSHITGIIALIVLVPTCLALYTKKLAGSWRRIYAIGAVLSLYLNVFVLVVQLFLKVPALHALAPGAPANPEPPFKIAQGVVLLLFVAIGFLAVKRFHPDGVARLAPT